MISFAELAQECAPTVAYETIQAVVTQESAFNPFAIGVNGGQLERQPRTKDEAIVTAKALEMAGYSIDLGYGQISAKNRAALGLTLEEVFDGCKNLAVAGELLESNYVRALKVYPGDPQRALQATLSAYNTGSFTAGLTNGYVGKLLAHAGKAAGVVVPAIEPIPLKQPTLKSQQTAKPAEASKPGATAKQLKTPGTGQGIKHEKRKADDPTHVYGNAGGDSNVLVYDGAQPEGWRPKTRR